MYSNVNIDLIRNDIIYCCIELNYVKISIKLIIYLIFLIKDIKVIGMYLSIYNKRQ